MLLPRSDTFVVICMDQTLLYLFMPEFLYSNLKGCPKYFKECAYEQIVLPSIYCSAIWDPYYQNAMHKVEMIQHRSAAHFIFWYRNVKDRWYLGWIDQPFNIAENVLDQIGYLNYCTTSDYSRLLFTIPITILIIITWKFLHYQPLIIITWNFYTINPEVEQISTNIHSFPELAIPEWNNIQVPNLENLNVGLSLMCRCKFKNYRLRILQV